MRQHIIVFLACMLTLFAPHMGVRANITNCYNVDSARLANQQLWLIEMEQYTMATNSCKFFNTTVDITGLPIFGTSNGTHNVSVEFYYTRYLDSNISIYGDVPTNMTLLFYDSKFEMKKMKHAVIMYDVHLHTNAQLLFMHTNAVWSDAANAGTMMQVNNMIMGPGASLISSNATYKNAKTIYNFSGSGPLYMADESALIFSITNAGDTFRPAVNFEQELVMSNRSVLMINRLDANYALHIMKLTMHGQSGLIMSNIVADEVLAVDEEGTASQDALLLMHNISSYNPIALSGGGKMRFTLEAVNVSVAYKPVDLQHPEDYLPMLGGFHVEEVNKDGTYANKTCSRIQCIDSNYMSNDEKACQCPCTDGRQGPTCIRLDDRTQYYMNDLTRPCTVPICIQCHDSQPYRCKKCPEPYTLRENKCLILK